MNFNWVVDSVVQQIPVGERDKTALSFDGRIRLTYAQLLERSLVYAGALRELGLRRGDRLGLLMYNDPEYMPLYLAAARLGVITVRLNFRLAPTEVGFILGDSGCSAVIVHSSLLGKLEPVRDELSVASYVVVPDSENPLPDWAQPFDALPRAAPLDPADAPALGLEAPMCLIYTSGTTCLRPIPIWCRGPVL